MYLIRAYRTDRMLLLINGISRFKLTLLVKNKNSNVKLLPKISSHIFRHTFATRINESGMNDKIRMSSLGHTDISITNEIYTDASDEMIKSEFNKFDDYLKNIERPQVTTEVATHLIH